MYNPPSSFLSFFSFLFALLIGSTFLGALLPGGMHVSKPENGGEQPFFRLWFHLMGCRTTTRWLHLITDLLLLNRADLMVRMIPFPASYSLPSIGTISFHLNDPILRQIMVGKIPSFAIVQHCPIVFAFSNTKLPLSILIKHSLSIGFQIF